MKTNKQSLAWIFSGTIIISLSIFAYLKFGNTDPKKKQQSIQAPVAAADLPFDQYRFRNDSAIKISRPTGTCIRISPNSFVFEDGKPATGNIQLNIREFHKTQDILRSGIPMRINANTEDQLESAGMIELRASSEGKNLKLSTEKTIDIDLAAFKPSEGYQLYYLENDSEWKVNDSFNTMENAGKKERMNAIEKVIAEHVRPDSISEDPYFVLDGNDQTKPYLSPFKGIEWEILEKSDIAKANLIRRINWDDVSITAINKKKLKYRLTFTYEGKDWNEKVYKKELSITAKPLMNGKNRRENRKDFAELLKAYDDKHAEYLTEKNRIDQEASLVNSFKINKMGIWNCDKLINLENIIYSKVSFDFEKNFPRETNNIKLFVIYKNSNSVISYSGDEWNKVGIPKDGELSLMAVLPGDQVAVVESEQIRSMISSGKNQMFFKTDKKPAVQYLLNYGIPVAKK